LRDEAEAEDVTQEVFLEIYRKAHLYDPARGAVRVWLLQYAYRRSLQRKHALRRSAAYCGEPLDDVDRSPSPLVSSSRQLTRQECRWVIRRGLAVLTSQQRATLELACLEEASLQEVAQHLRVSWGCARHYYYRGLKRLREWARFDEAERARRVSRAPARWPHRPVRCASTADTVGAGSHRARKPCART